jgi:hypothetical protein
MKKLFSVIILGLFMCLTVVVSAQSKTSISEPVTGFRKMRISDEGKSKLPFSVKSDQFKKYIVKEENVNYVVFLDKKGKIGYAGVEGSSGSGEAQTAGWILAYIRCIYNATDDSQTAACAKKYHLD